MFVILNGFAFLEFIVAFVTALAVGALLVFLNLERQIPWALVVGAATACTFDLVWRLKFAKVSDDDRLFDSRAGGSFFFLPAWPVWAALSVLVLLLKA